MPKKFLGWVLVAVAAVVPLAASAQQTGSTFQPPQIVVHTIILTTSSVAQGDTVHGTFVLQNQGTTNASNIGYRISLVGNYQPNTLPGTFYDTSALKGSVFVPANGSVTVPFTYTLPVAVSGKGLGIEIQAYTAAGIPLGWSDYHLTVNAKQGIVVPPSLAITNAQLKLGTSTFPLQAGPVVHTGETPTLVLTLGSLPKQSLTVVPHIDLYNRIIAGTPLQTATGTPITITHTTLSIPLPLPTTAGVYDTRVTLETSAGTMITAPFEVRYIVAGDIVTIQSLTATTTALTAGSVVTLTMQYTGAPFDIRTGAVVNEPVSTVHITLTDQANNVIGTYQGTLDPTTGTLTVPITLKNAATSLSATATVTAPNGALLATYHTVLFEYFTSSHQSALSLWLWVIVAVVLLLIVSLIIWLIRAKKNRMAMVPVAMLAVAGTLFCMGGQVARAQITTQIAPTMTAEMYDTSGNPVQTLLPGQQFWVRGTVVDASCANAAQSASFTFSSLQSGGTTVAYGPYTQSQAAYDSSSHSGWNYYFNFSYGSGLPSDGTEIPFTAPSTPGTYTITVTVNTISYYGIGNGYGTASVTLTYTVVPLVTVNLSLASPSVSVTQTTSALGSVTYATTTLGTPLTLDWNSTNATYCSNNFSISSALSGSAGVTPKTQGTYTYSENCGNPYSDQTGTVVINTVPPPPSATLAIWTPSGDVTATNTTPGTSVALQWTAQNATSCTANSSDPSSTFSTNSQTTGTAGVAPTTLGAHTYSVTCTGPEGTATSNTVGVNVANPPTATLSLTTPEPIITNQPFTLVWSSTNAQTCAPVWNGGGFATSNAPSGSDNAVALSTAGTYTYQVQCTGTTGLQALSNTVPVTISNPLTPTCGLGGPQIQVVWSPIDPTTGSVPSQGYTITITGNQAHFPYWTENISSNGPTSLTIPTVALGFSSSIDATLVLVGDSPYYVAVTYNNSGYQTPYAMVMTSTCPITALLDAAPTTVSVGENSTLSWTSTGGATVCSGQSPTGAPTFTANGGLIQGSQNISFTNPGTYTYGLTCTDNSGISSPVSNATITVTPASTPVISSFGFDPTSCTPSLSWTINNLPQGGTCYLSDNSDTNIVPVSKASGTYAPSPTPALGTVYTLTCGSSVETATVPQPPSTCSVTKVAPSGQNNNFFQF